MSERLDELERRLERLRQDAARLAEDAGAALRALREASVAGSAHAHDVMTADEVGELTGYTVQTVYRRARAGVLPCVRVGSRSVRFYRPAIEKWLLEGGQQQAGNGVSAAFSESFSQRIVPLDGGRR